MQSMREILTTSAEHPGSSFPIGMELVSTRGTMEEIKAVKAREFAMELAATDRIDWVSITDNAGGNPMLAPAALGKPLLENNKEVAIHLSCKDFNRNGLESVAWQLNSEGFHNILALSGDSPIDGHDGQAKPVFDIDSVGLITMLREMNQGLKVKAPGNTTRQLGMTRFFTGTVVNNFKRHESEVIPQYLKLDKKIENGARYIINQIGYDARKMDELLRYMQRQGHQQVPLVGNVYVLNPFVAQIFHTRKIPGVYVNDQLLHIAEKQQQSADKGRAFFYEFAAKQLAIYRGLGYHAGYLGGVHNYNAVDQILNIEQSFSGDDWKQFAREFSFSHPEEFYLFDQDETSGLSSNELNPSYLKSLENRSGRDLSYSLSKQFHSLMFTPGKGLAPLCTRICQNAKDPSQGPAWMRAVERLSKNLLFSCKDCGDCSLPETAFLCPESQCAKNQRNGPCGGTRDGLCEVADKACIWARAYDRLKPDAEELQLLKHVPTLQDQSLRGTSGWANCWLERDHIAAKKK
ncbi:methylenetetrahydrofolate reductase C-terminal domain-containing protein [Verrucomicrobiaceae bacterium N1E253]|uniref:Methylenetetrahydrofolate reductase n=1 Tax=Oceaniferula marina TaxID=2748318 RepID=A0A851GFR3_9BACT|nr:methylenetetrahydrofolate reductase C-terminal domain-containing protein [Oceaniferula marina]NWK54115.1 methylenetetrahydrofolate reductase C-terminal domain-containing protein [Oceaniferula marina]